MADLTLAVRKELAQAGALTALLGSSDVYDTWIFRWAPRVAIEGTGKCAIVISQRQGWTTPNLHNTAHFPRLQVEVWADPDRATDLQPAKANAEEKALAVFDKLDPLLHRPDKQGIYFDTLRVTNCHRLDEPDIAEVPGGDGSVRLIANYGFQL